MWGLQAIMTLRQNSVGIKAAKTHLQPISRLHEAKNLWAADAFFSNQYHAATCVK